MLDITKDIHSLTSFRRNSAQPAKQPAGLSLHHPTVKGKAEAVVQDAESYQKLLDIAAKADVYEAIRQGLDDVSMGRTMPANEVFEAIR